jgi:hypothetical protein
VSEAFDIADKHDVLTLVSVIVLHWVVPVANMPWLALIIPLAMFVATGAKTPKTIMIETAANIK